jgi:hypothetical protein
MRCYRTLPPVGAAPERLVWAVATLAEGLGIRAMARVFAVDPNTVLQCGSVANFEG